MSTKNPSIIKNIRVSQKYGVSRPTVGKWVENAQQGKNNLQLSYQNGRHYIVDNKHNGAEILRLKEHGVKYRNKIAFEKTTASKEFYNAFSKTQIIDILTNIEFKNRIPLKYTYLNGGADYWNQWLERKFKENPEYYIGETSELLNVNTNYLQYITSKYKKINIFDLGPGNGFATKQFLEDFPIDKTAITYTGIDISPRMLEILGDNIKDWFPTIETNYLCVDLDTETIQDELFSASIEEDSCNLILFTGATIGNYPNQRELLRKIESSMSANDLFVLNNYLDIPSQRTHLPSFTDPYKLKRLTWIPDLLGIKQDMYEQVYAYDKDKNATLFNLKFTKEVEIAVTIKDKEKILTIKEGSELNLWGFYTWYYHELYTIFDETGLRPNLISLNAKQDNVLVICQRKRNIY
jgi:uncharacterized SAM-dependent methyltransferase